MTAEPLHRPRARRVRLAVAAVLALVAVAGAFAWRHARHAERPDASAAETLYTCPMHPQIIRNKPGDCPICSMALVPKTAGQGAPPSGSPPPGERRILSYRHPMNPSIRSDRPAKDDMGMDFVPVYADEAMAAPTVAGRAMVDVPPERRQLLGIRSDEVKVSGAGGVVRTVGRVAVDESRRHHIHAKFPGFVEGLYVDAVGEEVRPGQALVSIFSPEVVAAQQEYLVARRARGTLADSEVPGVPQGGARLLDAARQRLRYLDISPAEIAQLEETGKPLRAIALRADAGGYVTEKNAFHGMRVTPGELLFELADLSTVWVVAEVYERDLAAVRLGMPVRVALPYMPGREWTGRVTFVSPTLDPKTRTAQLRVEVPNPRRILKPETFADVFLETAMGMAAIVPETAVIRTGERTLVFVDHGDGRYEPREIVLGERVSGGYQVLSGVAAGERVVVSANFLLDSESSLRAAIAAVPASPRP